MKKIFFLFLFSLSFNSSFANNIKCNFEEVYDDGSLQFGKVLFSNGLLRYQYEDNQLFTIIYNDNYYLVRNDNRKIVNKLEEDKVLDELSFILSDYPNIKKSYNNNDIEINLEKNLDDIFIKRISIKSEKANLSIYLLECEFKPIPAIYFHPFSFVELK